MPLRSLVVLIAGLVVSAPASAQLFLTPQAGAEQGATFQDFCDGAAVGVVVHAGWWIDGVRILCPGGAVGPMRGGSGGTAYEFRLEPGERVTRITGSVYGPAGPYVYALQIHTDRRTSPRYGEGGPDRGSEAFNIPVPDDGTFAGLVGSSGQFLHSIGLVFQTGEDLAWRRRQAEAERQRQAEAQRIADQRQAELDRQAEAQRQADYEAEQRRLQEAERQRQIAEQQAAEQRDRAEIQSYYASLRATREGCYLADLSGNPSSPWTDWLYLQVTDGGVVMHRVEDGYGDVGEAGWGITSSYRYTLDYYGERGGGLRFFPEGQGYAGDLATKTLLLDPDNPTGPVYGEVPWEARGDRQSYVRFHQIPVPDWVPLEQRSSGIAFRCSRAPCPAPPPVPEPVISPAECRALGQQARGL